MTSNAFVLTVVWLGLALHLIVGLVVGRHLTTAPLVPLLNLIVSSLILVYWTQRWFGYLFRGVTWHGTDQLVPAYALAVTIVAVVALGGRHQSLAFNWTVLVINGLILLAACLFFTFVRMDRLI